MRDCGVSAGGGGAPWRATFTENGRRRFRQGATEAELAARLEKVRERLQAGASNMERPGAELIGHYLDPDRLSADRRWSRKHAHIQRRLCERFAAPVTCQDITTDHMQQVVNAAPTAGEGARVAGEGARVAGEGARVAGNRRCRSAPPRSPPPATWTGSARSWAAGCMVSGMS